MVLWVLIRSVWHGSKNYRKKLGRARERGRETRPVLDCFLACHALLTLGKCYQMKLTAPYTPLKWVTFILELPGGPWLISLFHAPDRFFFQNRGTPIPYITRIVTQVPLAANLNSFLQIQLTQFLRQFPHLHAKNPLLTDKFWNSIEKNHFDFFWPLKCIVMCVSKVITMLDPQFRMF